MNDLEALALALRNADVETVSIMGTHEDRWARAIIAALPDGWRLVELTLPEQLAEAERRYDETGWTLYAERVVALRKQLAT